MIHRLCLAKELEALSAWTKSVMDVTAVLFVPASLLSQYSFSCCHLCDTFVFTLPEAFCIDK
jgi:hypothetical protein